MGARPAAPLYTRRFWLLYAAHLSIASSLLSFVLVPLRIEELGGGEMDIGWVAAVGGGAGVAIRWFSGRLSDRLGRRQVMLAAGILHAVACYTFIWVDSLWPAFYIVRVLLGVAQGALFAGFFTVAADIVPAGRRAEGLAIFGTSGMIGNWVGPFTGEMAIEAGGFPAFFALVGSVGVLGLALFSRLPETSGRLPPVKLDRALLRSSGLLPAFALSWLFGLAAGSYFNFLAPHLARLDDLRPSQFFLPYTIAALAVRVVGRRLLDRLGARRLLPPAFAALLAGIALGGQVETVWALRLAGLLGGIGHGYAFPLLNALVVRRTPPGARGMAVSLYTALIDLGVLIGAPALGAVAAHWDYGTMFRVTALAVAALGAVLGVDEARRARARTPRPA